jgi:hypothetical protein
MIKHLNPWLSGTLKKAQRLFEDSDRKTLADRLFIGLVKHVHLLATRTAISTTDPTLDRMQTDDGSVVLTLEWIDRSANWHLYFSVWRKLGEKPYVMLDFSGVTGQGYSCDKPTDADICKALHDYFEGWKK